MKVTKEITFDSAHMLSNYCGKCYNLHGHTYKLQVTLEGDVCKEECSEQGMVEDFNKIKQYLEYVANTFDHAIIFSDEAFRSVAENDLLHWAEKHSMNYVIVRDGKSTCESIAALIKSMFEDLQTLKVSVRLWETPASFVEV